MSEYWNYSYPMNYASILFMVLNEIFIITIRNKEWFRVGLGISHAWPYYIIVWEIVIQLWPDPTQIVSGYIWYNLNIVIEICPLLL